MNQLKLVTLVVILLVKGCVDNTEERGINLAIRNFTSHEYVMNVSLHDQTGYLLSHLAIPIKNTDKKVPFTYYHEINSDFDRLLVKAHLEQVPSGELLDKKIGFWPKDIGMPDGASSRRIMIEIGIIHFQNQVQIQFGSIL